MTHDFLKKSYRRRWRKFRPPRAREYYSTNIVNDVLVKASGGPIYVLSSAPPRLEECAQDMRLVPQSHESALWNPCDTVLDFWYGL
jgi:hypothetical protein